MRGHRTRARSNACVQRAINWLLAMQSKDGGWAAFDVDNNWEFLSDVPFADHNAMLDPTCPDITGRVLEALCAYGLDRTTSGGAARRGVSDRARRSRTAAGTAAGAWIISTARSWRCAGCSAAGESDREAHVLRAGEWLRSIQNADGGWGESCASYDNDTFTPAAEHAFADRLGDPGADRRRRYDQPQRAARASNI